MHVRTCMHADLRKRVPHRPTWRTYSWLMAAFCLMARFCAGGICLRAPVRQAPLRPPLLPA